MMDENLSGTARTQGGYQSIRAELIRRLAEPAPARVQMLTGPRQVGKTTLLLEMAGRWGKQAMYLAADAPEAALPGWWERQWLRAADLARGGPAALLIDEIQYLPDWSRRLKAEVDRLCRTQTPLHVVVAGSAALRLRAGSREAMAGRLERLTLIHWSAADLSEAFGLSREQAVDFIVRLGGFPGTVALRHDLPRWRAYVRDSIIDPAIGRDLLQLEAVRRPDLLRQVFAVSVGHASEIVSLHKMAGMLADRGALGTISHYLDLLAEAYLVATPRKFSQAEIRRRSSPPKLLPLNNALIAASTHDHPPTPAADPERWGRLVENACLAFAINSGQTLHYWREDPLEVDAVLTGSWGKLAVEIKTTAFTARDLAGLLEFSRRFRDYRPLVVCAEADQPIASTAGVEAISWQRFLWEGIAG